VLHGDLKQLFDEKAGRLYAFPEQGALVEAGLDPQLLTPLDLSSDGDGQGNAIAWVPQRIALPAGALTAGNREFEGTDVVRRQGLSSSPGG
jgi:hypothetical protein